MRFFGAYKYFRINAGLGEGVLPVSLASGLAKGLVLSLVLALGLGLAGCGTSVEAPKPADLGPNISLLSVRTAWTAQIGAVQFPLALRPVGNTVFVAASDGTVAALDARTGQDLWRMSVKSPVSSGVGSDGRYVAVVTQGNELVMIDGGREAWRQSMSALSFTAPLVAGARVFVLSADRSVTAFDAATGRKLWSQTRPGEPLVLRQAGILQSFEDTLLVGLSGRLVGMNPANGSSRWEAPIAVPRGTNDVERLVDLVAQTSRQGSMVCVRAYQAAVGCVNAVTGAVAWTKPSQGSVGVHADEQNVYTTQSDGKIFALRPADGEKVWESERLKHRHLSAPLAIGRVLAIGDNSGVVHLVSTQDGAPQNRLNTDGSAIISSPVMVAGTLIVATQNGGLFGFRPE